MAIHAIRIKKTTFRRKLKEGGKGKSQTRHCVLAIVDKADLPAKMRNRLKTPIQMHGCFGTVAGAKAKAAELERKIKKPGGKVRAAKSHKRRARR